MGVWVKFVNWSYNTEPPWRSGYVSKWMPSVGRSAEKWERLWNLSNVCPRLDHPIDNRIWSSQSFVSSPCLRPITTAHTCGRKSEAPEIAFAGSLDRMWHFWRSFVVFRLWSVSSAGDNTLACKRSWVFGRFSRVASQIRMPARMLFVSAGPVSEVSVARDYTIEHKYWLSRLEDYILRSTARQLWCVRQKDFLISCWDAVTPARPPTDSRRIWSSDLPFQEGIGLKTSAIWTDSLVRKRRSSERVVCIFGLGHVPRCLISSKKAGLRLLTR